MSKIETKKRKANSPILSREKESLSDSISDNMADYSSQQINLDSATETWDNSSSMRGASSLMSPSPSNQHSRRGSVASKDSYLSVASRTTQQTEKPTRESVFTTSKPEGAFRDEIVVELQTLDNQVFKGSITLKEARKKIFEEILGFKQSNLSGLILGYSGGPIVTYKLSSQINIDTLESFQFFELERNSDDGSKRRKNISPQMQDQRY